MATISSPLVGPTYYSPGWWKSTATPTPTDAPGSGAGVDPLALAAAVNDLMGFQADAETYKAAAEGSRFSALGAGIEAEAYGTAAGIAEENARTEQIAESVRQVQITKEVDRTVGSIKAATAANGFIQGGSALDIMASTMREGYLSQQISGMQSQQAERGHLEQQAAAQGEMAAAGVRQMAALSLAAAQDKTSLSATANQTALSGALTQLLAGDPNASKLVADLMAGDLSAVNADLMLYNPGGSSLVTASDGAAEADTASVFAQRDAWRPPSVWSQSGGFVQGSNPNISIGFKKSR